MWEQVNIVDGNEIYKWNEVGLNSSNDGADKFEWGGKSLRVGNNYVNTFQFS